LENYPVFLRKSLLPERRIIKAAAEKATDKLDDLAEYTREKTATIT
jgi:hypothetical protein